MRWPWWRLWKFQRRGPILDILRRRKPAIVVCKHWMIWPEGDYTASNGGKACDLCVAAWKAERRS